MLPFFIASLATNLVFAAAVVIYREQLHEARAASRRIVDGILQITRRVENETIRDAKSIFQESDDDDDNANNIPTIKFPRPELKVYRD